MNSKGPGNALTVFAYPHKQLVLVFTLLTCSFVFVITLLLLLFLQDIDWAISAKVDFIAVSFVRTADVITNLRSYIQTRMAAQQQQEAGGGATTGGGWSMCAQRLRFAGSHTTFFVACACQGYIFACSRLFIFARVLPFAAPHCPH